MAIPTNMLDTKLMTMGGLTVLSAGFINNITVPLFGVPLTVVVIAIGGALASFAYGEPAKNRKTLYTMAAVNAFLATLLVAVLPKAMGWQWAIPKIEPAMAGLIAALLRFAVPAFISLIPDIIKKIFKLDKYSQQNTFYSQEEAQIEEGAEEWRNYH